MSTAAHNIEAAILRALTREWTTINQSFFKWALRPPQFELTDGGHHLAEWRRSHRTIAFSREFIRNQTWGVVVEVLKHEMAHQYTHEVLRAVDESAHGPAFQGVCRRLGIDATASGMPVVPGLDPEQDRVMRRIQRLLALAESPNANEAQAAMAAARKLMLRYNIDTTPKDHGFRQLGKPMGRLFEHDRWLASVLVSHFFVSVVWVPSFDTETGKDGRVVEICGTPANLEMAAYVFDFLRQTSERLWREHKRANGIAGDKDRLRFLAGVMRGFHEKLQEGARQSQAEGLVWVGDPRLQGYFERRHPSVRTIKYGGAPITDAWMQGRAAGREIVLHKPVAESAGNRGRLLG